MAERSTLRAQAEGGDPSAQFALANRYWPEDGGNEIAQADMDEAIKWLRKAAEQSHVRAQMRLAELLGKDDVEETLRWLRLAAEQGNPEAAMKRCYYLMEFLGDEAQGVKWYKLAIQAGHPHRGDALGISAPVYRDFVWGKRIVPPKEKIPRERRLAKAGDPGAQYRLGALFANGASVSLDYVQAYGWFAVAARPDLNPSMTTTSKRDAVTDWRTAARAVRILEQVMEESELDLARRLASDYLSRFGGRVALEARIFHFAESCAFLFVGIMVVLPVLMLRGLWTRFCASKTGR